MGLSRTLEGVACSAGTQTPKFLSFFFQLLTHVGPVIACHPFLHPESMANTKSATKRARQTAQRTLRNKSVLTGLKRQQNKLQIAVASGDVTKARVELSLLSARLDKAAKRGIVHKNLANRRKSRAAKVVARTALRTAEAPPQAAAPE